MLGLVARKIGMTTIYRDDGEAIPVTVLKAGPCEVLMVKNEERDGYKALQVGFDVIEKKLKANKPLQGHFDKASGKAYKVITEFRLDDVDVEPDYKTGDMLDVSIFKESELVNVLGTSKGKGFAGVVKKYSFHGGPKSHGQSDTLRSAGSIGMAATPSRVLKNHKMPGHMGSEKVTEQGLQIVDIDDEASLICVRGAVPGANNQYVKILKRN